MASGSGIDVAKETGNVILIRDDILDVVAAVQAARSTMWLVKQNLFGQLRPPYPPHLRSQHLLTYQPPAARVTIAPAAAAAAAWGRLGLGSQPWPDASQEISAGLSC